VRVIGEQIEKLISEGGEWSGSADARMIVKKEDQFPERRELVREGLRERRETPLETAALIEGRCELLAECRGVAPQRPDQIREQDEGILVVALQREPCRPAPRRSQEVGVLGEHRRLSVTGGRVHERQSVTPGAFEPVEKSLPSKEWERQ